MWYHFIAIGGSAMHNLALDLHQKGHTITGSDDEIFEPSYSRLQSAGILPDAFGWFPEKINTNIDAVIVGMHARPDNPELLKVKELGIPYYSYPEYLYLHAQNKKRIVVGGSHGKTTITSIVLHILKHTTIPFDYMVGAQIKGFDRMVKLSDEAELMIFEGDEYLTAPFDPRPKFHVYKPHIALVSGIAWDHMNVFKTFDDYVHQFRIFADTIEPNGTFIWYKNDPNLQQIATQLKTSIRSVSYEEHPHVIEQNQTFLLHKGNKIPISIFGKHNLQNIMGAKEICLQIGIQEEVFYQAIQTFEGASKRLQKLYENSEEQLTVFLDFAHAPSKVKATIDAVRWLYPSHFLIGCLELHTYSSLSKDFLPQYAGCMDLCDLPIVYFNPHAIELKKLPMLSEQDIAEGFKNKKLKIFNQSRQLFDFITTSIKKNCVILLMSSGNFDNFEITEWLKTLTK